MIWISEDGLGALVPQDEALISVRDRGLTVGLGAFETLLVRDGRAMAPTRHLRRLESSLAILGLPSISMDAIREGIDEALAANKPVLEGPARLRITVTAGVGSTPTITIATATFPQWPATTSLLTVPWVRNERSSVAGAKTTSYAENAVALAAAQAQGYAEALFANSRGDACEGSASNIFIVTDGLVRTPSLECGPLPGVTRGLVCDWFEVIETRLAMHEVEAADEIFLTSATRGVHPVTRFDGRELAIGPTTSRIRAEFDEMLRLNSDPQ